MLCLTQFSTLNHIGTLFKRIQQSTFRRLTIAYNLYYDFDVSDTYDLYYDFGVSDTWPTGDASLPELNEPMDALLA